MPRQVEFHILSWRETNLSGEIHFRLGIKDTASCLTFFSRKMSTPAPMKLPSKISDVGDARGRYWLPTIARRGGFDIAKMQFWPMSGDELFTGNFLLSDCDVSLCTLNCNLLFGHWRQSL